jgi:hypothetical protein
VLGDEIAGRGRHVQEAVDGADGAGRLRAAELRTLGGEAVGFRHRVDRGPDDGVVGRLGHALAHEINRHAPAAQRAHIVVGVGDRRREIRPEAGRRHVLLLHGCESRPRGPPFQSETGGAR